MNERFPHRLAALAICAGVLAVPGASRAQQTRTQAIEQAQADKAKVVTPYAPNRAERILDRIEQGAWLDPGFLHGFYPSFGSIFPGGGFTFGGGYRTYTGYQSHVDVRALYSLANFKQIEVSAAAPQMYGGTLDLTARAGWRDATQVPFHGLGVGTSVDDRTNGRINESYIEGAALYRPTKRTFIRGGIGLEDFVEKRGQGDVPSVEDRFDATTAPRLGEDPRFVHLQAQVGIDWLDSPLYSRRGGFYRWGYHQYVTPGAGQDFATFRTDLVQHVPILRETWVLSLRGRTESVVGGEAPYFLTPWLGDGNTLRAYGTARFRDRHTALVSGEWRWIPNRLGLDLALFVDAGTVASEFASLSLRDVRTDYGAGVRFHTLRSTVLRLDVARGTEGWRVVLATSAPF